MIDIISLYENSYIFLFSQVKYMPPKINYLIDDEKDKRLLKELHEPLKKDKGLDMPKVQVFKENYAQQADVLYLPNDKGFKYCLVVVDNHSKKVDAVPLREISSATVLRGFKKIYEDNTILKLPYIIQVDSGSEFKGVVKEYFHENEVLLRRGKTDRHRQQTLAEYKNKIIGRELYRMMNLQEIKTGMPSSEWLKYLPKLLKKINENLPKPLTEPITEDPIVTQSNHEILPIGSMVRVALEAPINIVSGKKLHGKFRASDIRYSLKPKKITNYIIKDGYPILYQVEDESTGYTRNQLKPMQTDDVQEQAIKRKEKELIKKAVQALMSKETKNKIPDDSIGEHKNHTFKIDTNNILEGKRLRKSVSK